MKSKEKKDNLDKIHKSSLGLGLPENYFSNSESEILDKIASENKAKVISFYQNKRVWFIAAGISLLVALTVFKPNVFPNIEKNPSIVSDTVNKFQNLNLVYDLFFTDDQDIAVASLFMDDIEINNYLADKIVEEIIIDEEIDYFMLENILDEDIN